MNILGIDFGTKKIGLALLESTTEVIVPLSPIKVTKQLDADLEKTIKSYNIQAFVIGVPNNESMIKKIKSFGQKLELKYQKPVHLSGEDFSSKEARSMLLSLRESHQIKTNKFGQKDSMSALVILEDWLNNQG